MIFLALTKNPPFLIDLNNLKKRSFFKISNSDNSTNTLFNDDNKC